jgi:hypothetical protein
MKENKISNLIEKATQHLRLSTRLVEESQKTWFIPEFLLYSRAYRLHKDARKILDSIEQHTYENSILNDEFKQTRIYLRYTAVVNGFSQN